MRSEGGEVTAERLANALIVLARIVAADERALPLYERIEREFEAMQARESTLERARALANRASGTLQQRLQHQPG